MTETPWWRDYAGVTLGWGLGLITTLALDWWQKSGVVKLDVTDAWARYPGAVESDACIQVCVDLTLRISNTRNIPQHIEIADIRYLDSAGKLVCSDVSPRLSIEAADRQNSIELPPTSFTRIVVSTSSELVEVPPHPYDADATLAIAKRVASVEVDILVLPKKHRTIKVKLSEMKAMLDPKFSRIRREYPFT